MNSRERRIAERVAFKYKPKETKEHKVDRLMRKIRDATGFSKGVAADLADALVRGRDVERLALQKSWPLENGVFEGPSGTISLEALRGAAADAP